MDITVRDTMTALGMIGSLIVAAWYVKGLFSNLKIEIMTGLGSVRSDVALLAQRADLTTTAAAERVARLEATVQTLQAAIARIQEANHELRNLLHQQANRDLINGAAPVRAGNGG